MHIKPIRTKAGHRAALKEIEALMVARAGTPGGERLDVLVTLVEAWEKNQLIAKITPDGLPRSSAVTRPVEIYSDKRIREFNAAEASVDKSLRRKKKPVR